LDQKLLIKVDIFIFSFEDLILHVKIRIRTFHFKFWN